VKSGTATPRRASERRRVSRVSKRFAANFTTDSAALARVARERLENNSIPFGVRLTPPRKPQRPERKDPT
jgi:hypothetical protein